MDEVARAFQPVLLARPACGVDLVSIEDDVAPTKVVKAVSMINAVKIEMTDVEVLFTPVILSFRYL